MNGYFRVLAWDLAHPTVFDLPLEYWKSCTEHKISGF